jgi:hypothetical protein
MRSVSEVMVRNEPLVFYRQVSVDPRVDRPFDFPTNASLQFLALMIWLIGHRQLLQTPGIRQ